METQAIVQNTKQAIATQVDKAVEARWEPAQRNAEDYRKRYPHLTADELAQRLARKIEMELATLGVATGGAAAAPGVGGGLVLLTSGADTAAVTWRLVDLILTTAALYGHTNSDVDERKLWIIAVLGLSMGGQRLAADVARVVGAKGGAKMVKAIPMPVIYAINRRIGGQVFVKWGTKRGVVRLGTVVPFGLGAGLGGGFNYAHTRAIGRAARDFFGEEPSQTTPIVTAA